MGEQTPSDLGSRFHALPFELRAHIFSVLLVRPVKWDMLHFESCERSMEKTTSEYRRPSHHDLQLSKHSYICAECGPHTHERNWRHAFERGYEVFVSPWRSKWAPPQSNPFLCTGCYDDRWRTPPFPEPTNLPCLCARHKNLEARLVCRQWNIEVSKVFFSENVFAFDDCISMRCFFAAVSWDWKILITKVSLLVPMWQEDDKSVPNTQLLATSLCVLNDLTWLRDLELDAKLLNKEATVSALLSCGLPSLRRVRFVVQCPYKKLYWRTAEPPTQVWGELGRRLLLTGGFPEFVARSIKSQARITLTAARIAEKVKRQRQLYNSLQRDAELWRVPPGQCVIRNLDSELAIRIYSRRWKSKGEAGEAL